MVVESAVKMGTQEAECNKLKHITNDLLPSVTAIKNMSTEH